ncbi:MAG: hypothetical protein EBT26_07705 [Microbacteriaceae bacterium]|nr:hypothetical protein [Microbacteriaceae bacterium]NBS61902.1 hypothetical protein [Microbacteriaceae bacterium]
MIFGYLPNKKYQTGFKHGNLTGRQYTLTAVQGLIMSEIRKLDKDQPTNKALISELWLLIHKIEEMYDQPRHK